MCHILLHGCVRHRRLQIIFTLMVNYWGQIMFSRTLALCGVRKYQSLVWRWEKFKMRLIDIDRHWRRKRKFFWKLNFSKILFIFLRKSLICNTKKIFWNFFFRNLKKILKYLFFVKKLKKNFLLKFSSLNAIWSILEKSFV